MDATSARNGRASRVFVVEDEALIAMELLERLEELGYQACGHAASGEHAMHAIAQVNPDAVLMDIHLGAGIDGIETTRRLQATHDVPVVFLTAYGDRALIGRATAANAFGYVLKPFNDRTIHAALSIAIARHQADRSLRRSNAALSSDVDRSSRQGILPICMDCKKIRDGSHGWQRLEVFLAARTRAQLSHGYCPECARQAYIAHGFEPPTQDDLA